MTFFFGTDYYPEHWPEERWPHDVQLMKDAGFNVARLAEFAWSRLEPREGQFDFGWLDRAIALLHENGVQVVLGTPTASAPPWVMAQQPDLYRVTEDGARLHYGNRREYCPNHPLYHDLSARIVRTMAEHYRDNPAVIGWQIDNEFGARCYCDICRAGFQQWLQTRYGALDELNARWGTAFWSHEYTEWSQIPTPSRLGNSPNPGLALDYYRFMSDSYRAYQKMQIDILRAACPEHFITHNLMGFKYPLLNYFDMTEDLDFVAWDDYWRTQWNMEAAVHPSFHALNHDTMRGLKKQNFWVMEQQSGGGGWELVSVPPKPGELRLWTYASIAHGADGIVYFRWRTCRTGTEQYWHGILDHHGQVGRRYVEVQQVGAELARLGDMIAGSEVRAPVAIMQSYDARFAFQVQPNNPRFSYEGHVHDLYKGFYEQQVSIDIVSEHDPLHGYAIVVVPALYVLRENTVAALRAFAEAGGVVIVTPRTGIKDAANAVVEMKLPGLLADLCGVEVEEYVSMPTDTNNGVEFNGETFTASVWADVLAPRGAEVVGRYTQDYYAGQPAITLNPVSQGKVIYLGAMGDSLLYDALARWALDLAGVAPLLKAAPRVEVGARWQGEERLLFVLNHSGQPQTLTLDGAYQDAITGAAVQQTARLAPYDVLILTRA